MEFYLFLCRSPGGSEKKKNVVEKAVRYLSGLHLLLILESAAVLGLQGAAPRIPSVYYSYSFVFASEGRAFEPFLLCRWASHCWETDYSSCIITYCLLSLLSALSPLQIEWNELPCFFFFFAHPIYYPSTALALPPGTRINSSNSDPGSRSGPFFPLPTTCLHFYREDYSALFCLVDSHRITPTHVASRGSQQYIFFFKISPRWDSTSKTNSRINSVRG